MVNLLDLSYNQLVEFIRKVDEPLPGAAELWKCLYRRYETNFETMTGLGPSLKKKLDEFATLGTLEPLEEVVSADFKTTKVLFRLGDDKTIESTLMLFRNSGSGRERRTVCVSSQVGCSVGCPYCATGQQGFERNLSTGEIIGQILYFIRRLDGQSEAPVELETRRPSTNVVFMGMGEPMANYENVRQAVAIINSQRGLGLGSRQVTLSTSGMATEIIRLSQESIQCQLAVSLHAANNELRNQLVPINRKYPLEELISACSEYRSATGRNIYVEYALFADINDSLAHADELVQLLTGLNFAVNLIPCNATVIGFSPSNMDRAHAFQKRLIGGGIRAMLRASRGSDIEAGCGQLRSRWLDGRQPGCVEDGGPPTGS
jgi:23S rRNA (adenine2503-C2)-methyltransferase